MFVEIWCVIAFLLLPEGMNGLWRLLLQVDNDLSILVNGYVVCNLKRLEAIDTFGVLSVSHRLDNCLEVHLRLPEQHSRDPAEQ